MGTQAVELPFTPIQLLSRHAHEPFVFLLDGQGEGSWGNDEAWFGFRPRAVLRIAALQQGEVERRGVVEVWRGAPFELLERFCREHVAASDADGRFVVAALNYELRRSIERFGEGPPSDPPLPLLVAAAYDWTLNYSYRTQTYTWHAADTAGSDLDTLLQHGREPVEKRRGARSSARSSAPPPAIQPERSRAQHEQAVRRVLDYIAAGDAYQVNLAQRFSGRGSFDGVDIFRNLQRLNCVPFGAYADLGDLQLISNSPECLLQMQGDRLRTFPIKGTRQRGRDAGEDRQHAEDLLKDAKERAEHVMIVDIERNDLGRVCRTGSVRVERFAELRSFPGLHHLVSCVRGERRPEVGLAELLGAMFPSGSVTGAPKIRAMQIIDELELRSRGFYTGALGYIRSMNDALFSLTIRTAMLRDEQIWYWAGGGIVADSKAEREYDETILKAQPFLTAVNGKHA